MAFFIFLHCAVAVLLMGAILMQSGKGGGLTEQFASAESIFGARTNVMMVKATAVLATIFLVTSISLAVFSSKQSESLMMSRKAGKSPLSSGTSMPHTQNAVPVLNAEAIPSAGQAVDAAAKMMEEPKPVSTGDAQKPQ